MYGQIARHADDGYDEDDDNDDYLTIMRHILPALFADFTAVSNTLGVHRSEFYKNKCYLHLSTCHLQRRCENNKILDSYEAIKFRRFHKKLYSLHEESF